MLLADANVVVAIVLGDADPHWRAAAELVSTVEARGWRMVLTEGVLVEAAWVLRKRGEMTQREVSASLLGLLDSAAFDSWDPPLVSTALRIMADEPRLDLVDALLVAREALGEAQVVTLDRVLARTIAREHGRG
jgi:predicted nucleic acid-binding protein